MGTYLLCIKKLKVPPKYRYVPKKCIFKIFINKIFKYPLYTRLYPIEDALGFSILIYNLTQKRWKAKATAST